MREKVTIKLSTIGNGSAQSDLINASITITNIDTSETIATETYLGSDIIVLIEPSVNYSISVSAVTGYRTPTSKIRKSYALNEVTISFVYPSSSGIYIMDKQGDYYDSQTWSDAKTTGAVTNGDANGIACLGTNANFLIAPFFTQSKIGDEADRYTSITDPTVFPRQSVTDFNGSYNTSRWLARYSNHNAAYIATNYTYPDGIKNGYIPASGQLKYVIDNRTTISSLLSDIGLTMPTSYIWSSTNCGYVGDWGSVTCCTSGIDWPFMNVYDIIIIRNIS